MIDDLPSTRDEVVRYAEQVFGDVMNARVWLFQPKDRFADQKPITLCETPEGCRQVAEMLGQIDHGMFA